MDQRALVVSQISTIAKKLGKTEAFVSNLHTRDRLPLGLVVEAVQLAAEKKGKASKVAELISQRFSFQEIALIYDVRNGLPDDKEFNASLVQIGALVKHFDLGEEDADHVVDVVDRIKSSGTSIADFIGIANACQFIDPSYVFDYIDDGYQPEISEE